MLLSNLLSFLENVAKQANNIPNSIQIVHPIDNRGIVYF